MPIRRLRQRRQEPYRYDPTGLVNGTTKRMAAADEMYLGSTRTVHRKSTAPEQPTTLPNQGPCLFAGFCSFAAEAQRIHPSRNPPPWPIRNRAKPRVLWKYRVREQPGSEPQVKATIEIGIVVPDSIGYGKDAAILVDPR